MKRTIVLDLDGTLCDHTPRMHLAQASEWEAYNLASQHDKPNVDVRAVINWLEVGGFEILALTGRNERFRGITDLWFRRYEIPVYKLLMRPDGDYSHTPELKLRLLEEHFGGKEKVLEEVLFALDDNDKVVETFRNYGLPCWQVRQGVF